MSAKSNNNNDSSSSSSGNGCCGPVILIMVIFITSLFVILKLTGVIDWAWLAVLSPLLIYLAATLGTFLVCGVCVIAILIVILLFTIVCIAIAEGVDWLDL